jgi:hypothetical protein
MERLKTIRPESGNYIINLEEFFSGKWNSLDVDENI